MVRRQVRVALAAMHAKPVFTASRQEAARRVATTSGTSANQVSLCPEPAEVAAQASAVIAAAAVSPVQVVLVSVQSRRTSILMGQMAHVNLVAPTARRPPTTRLRARAQETRP